MMQDAARASLTGSRSLQRATTSSRTVGLMGDSYRSSPSNHSNSSNKIGLNSVTVARTPVVSTSSGPVTESDRSSSTAMIAPPSRQERRMAATVGIVVVIFLFSSDDVLPNFIPDWQCVSTVCRPSQLSQITLFTMVFGTACGTVRILGRPAGPLTVPIGTVRWWDAMRTENR